MLVSTLNRYFRLKPIRTRGVAIITKIVQEPLRHAHISMTLDTYSQVLPSMQKEGTGKLDDLSLSEHSSS